MLLEESVFNDARGVARLAAPIRPASICPAVVGRSQVAMGGVAESRTRVGTLIVYWADVSIRRCAVKCRRATHASHTHSRRIPNRKKKKRGGGAVTSGDGRRGVRQI